VGVKRADGTDSHIHGPTAHQNVDANNESNNFRMKTAHGNQSTDNKNDNAIDQALNDGGETKLNVAQEERLARQSKQIQQGDYSLPFKQEARGETKEACPGAWDDRKNVGEQRKEVSGH